MTTVQIKISEELDKNINLKKVSEDFNNKGDVIIKILEDYFNIKSKKK